MGASRGAGLVIALVLLLAVAGCGGSEDDSSPAAQYGTDLTIARDVCCFYHGRVRSKVKECIDGRRVLLFEQRPGRDRGLGAAQSGVAPSGIDAIGRFPEDAWGVMVAKSKGLQRGDRIYAKAIRKERSDYVCRADRSKTLVHLITVD